MNKLTIQDDDKMSARLDRAFNLLGDRLDGSLPANRLNQLEPIPEQQCHAIIEIVNNLDVPAGNIPELNDTAIALVGAFPDHGKHDSNIYLSHLIMLLAEFPIDTHQKAILNLVRSCRFLPSICEVEKALGEVRGKWLMAKLAANKSLKRLEKAKPPEKTYTDEERAANKAKFDKLIAETFAKGKKRDGEEFHCTQCDKEWMGDADSVCPVCKGEE